MTGTTNSIFNTIHTDNSDHLIVWLDGTDFVNHSKLGDNIVVTNSNNYITLTTSAFNGQMIPCYDKAAANSNGINISPFSYFTSNNYTFSCWGNRKANSNYMNLCTIGISSNPFTEIRLRQATNGSWRVNYGQTTSQSSIDINSKIELDTWHHYCVTYYPGMYKMYFDGQCSWVVTQHITAIRVPTVWRVLGSTLWNDTGGASQATDYRFYDTALSATQIAELYAKGPQTH